MNRRCVKALDTPGGNFLPKAEVSGVGNGRDGRKREREGTELAGVHHTCYSIDKLHDKCSVPSLHFFCHARSLRLFFFYLPFRTKH